MSVPEDVANRMLGEVREALAPLVHARRPGSYSVVGLAEAAAELLAEVPPPVSNRPVSERLADSDRLDAAARAHFAARRAGDPSPPPIALPPRTDGAAVRCPECSARFGGMTRCPWDGSKLEPLPDADPTAVAFYEALSVGEVVAALRQGAEWHGKGSAARQRLKLLAIEADREPPCVIFERTAGAEPEHLGRPVRCALDDLLAAFEPDA